MLPTFKKLHIVLTVLELGFFGVINITAAKQIIWKNAPTYKPYRINVDKILSCGISNASILLYATNNSTFIMRRKHDMSHAQRNATIVRDCFFLFVWVWEFVLLASILSICLLVSIKYFWILRTQFPAEMFIDWDSSRVR